MQASKFENKNYPKVRVTKQAHARLVLLTPAIREARGVNCFGGGI